MAAGRSEASSTSNTSSAEIPPCLISAEPAAGSDGAERTLPARRLRDMMIVVWFGFVKQSGRAGVAPGTAVSFRGRFPSRVGRRLQLGARSEQPAQPSPNARIVDRAEHAFARVGIGRGRGALSSVNFGWH